IGRALLHFQTELEDIVAHPDRCISELQLLTNAERHQVLVAFNDTAVEYPTNVSLHSFFEAQVERTPDAVALIYEEEKLTYRELNERSNRLAYRLRQLGVQADDLIGICSHRSLEMVIGLYGIIKAGAA